MAINEDRSGLPKTRSRKWVDPERKPEPPNAGPELRGAVRSAVESWFEAWQAREGFVRPMAVADREWRGSWSGTRCDRAAWYQATGEERTDPAPVSAHWRMAAGQMAHELLDTHLGAALEEAAATLFDIPRSLVVARFEVAVDLLGPLGVSGASTADWVVYQEVGPLDLRPLLTVEVKTKGGYKFKLAATTFNGPPEGPDEGDVIQGTLAAAALGTPLWVLYLSLENLSRDVAQRHGLDDEQLFSAGWLYSAEDAARIAAAEVPRIQRILDEPMLPRPRIDADPEVPPNNSVTPGQGTWTAVLDGVEQNVVVGRTWRCDYCAWRQRCIADG